MRAEALEVLDTDARIPYVRRRGEYLYNFWRDAANPRGLWRRTTLDSYRSDAPDWDVLIDVDELARDDDENWVWSGAIVIEPEFDRALVNLSRGGADAVIVREFDMQTREFVDGGFELPEAKTQIGWDDPDTVLVGTDFGPDSLTESGYPRIVKRWRRGTPIDEAELVFEGSSTDVSVGGSADRTPGFERTFVARVHRLLEQRALRTARPGTDPHRRSLRREQCLDPPRVAADRTAHRLGRSATTHLSRRFTAGRRLRRIPRRPVAN